ncbi:hypothetical protein PFLUV_G00188600 [Perca fluviatilis]|uniref:Uncharacterized protein n=1 Tax=Perca fluviatilis TaxID=8168 RepID=A0A6A5EBL2_PERFL|nr:hypothetical protein PFLUV_G00188600 [Perca fluviatilis]
MNDTQRESLESPVTDLKTKKWNATKKKTKTTAGTKSCTILINHPVNSGPPHSFGENTGQKRPGERPGDVTKFVKRD